MDEINLLDYIEVLLLRKRTVIAVTVAVVLVAGIALALTPKTYEGEATLLFPERTTDGLSSQLAQLAGIPMLGGLPSLSGRSVYVTVLKSRTISENVCQRVGLDKYGLEYEDLQDNLIMETPKEGGLILTCQVPTSWLRGHVPTRELRNRTAELAARVANTYISELRIYDRLNALFVSKKNRLFIEKQLQRTRAELADSEAALQEFQEQHPTLVPPEKSSVYADQALGIVARQTEADVALHEVGGQLARARATWKAGAPRDISPEAVTDSPAIGELRAQLARLEVKRATLLENFTESHPDVVGLTQEIEKTYDRIRSEVAQVVAGKAGSTSPAHQELLKQLVLLEVSRGGMEARRSALATAMSNIERRLSGLPAKEIEYARLLRDVKATETVYTTLLAEHAKARVAEGRESENFIVLDDAIVPEKPAKPRVLLTLAAALVLGLMFGVLIASVQGMPPGKR